MSLVRSIPHSFDFGQEVRDELILSDDTKVRIAPDDLKLKLLADSDGVFPTDNDLNIITQEINPLAAKAWTGFQVMDEVPSNTALQYRLHDGTDEYYWKNYPTDLLVLAHFNDFAGQTFNLDYFRDGTAPTITPKNSPAIVAPGVVNFGAGALECVGSPAEGVLYQGTQLVTLIDTGTVRFRVKPNYSGTPIASQAFFSCMGIGINNAVLLAHDTATGNIALFIIDSIGATIIQDITVGWNPTAGTWYEWELVFDTTPGSGFGAVIRINGVSVLSVAGTGTRDGTTSDYAFGAYGIISDIQDFTLDEAHIYNAVKHTSDYTPETQELADPAWTIAGASDWNTEAEIYTNIGSFPVSKLRIVVNLKSTDGVSTPDIQSILVGYQAEICFLDDWVYRTLVPYFEDNVRPWARYIIEKATTGTTVDLNDFPLDSKFVIEDVARVYNHTDDPNHSMDILSSYDSGTKVITLTVSVDAGKDLWIEFVYAPPVIVTTTSTDFTQVRSVPCIVLENIRIIDRQRFWVNNSVVDKATGDLVIYPPSWTIKLALDVVMLAPTSVDGMRLTETVQAYLENNRTIRAQGTDIPYDINVIDAWGRADMTEFSNLETSRMSIEVCNLQAWLRTALTGEKAIQNFKITGDNISVVI